MSLNDGIWHMCAQRLRLIARLGSSLTPSSPGRNWHALNTTRGIDLATRLDVASTSRDRNKGLLGRDDLSPGEGLWILPCQAVHTAWMKFPIDLVYLRRDGTVVAMREDLVPWRISGCLCAHSVLELPAGCIEFTRTRPGDTIVIAPLPSIA